MTPQIDFDKFAVEYIPPVDRKYPFLKGWISALISQIKRSYFSFRLFLDGVPNITANKFNALTVYPIDSRVIYDRKVYISLIPGNSTVPDANPKNWQLVSDYFIGFEERMLYDFNRITMEFALNKFFGGVFRQPNSAVNYTRSDIYIDTIVPESGSFLSYKRERNSDRVYPNISSNYIFATEIFTGSTTYTFEILFPTAIWINIDPVPAKAESIVRQFMNQFVPAGIICGISQY